MRAPQNRMQPGLPAPLPPCYLWASAVNHDLCMIGPDSPRRECRSDVPLYPKPLIEEISDRRPYADGVGVESGRLKAEPGKAESELPAIVIAAPINKPGLGRRCWISSGRFCKQHRAQMGSWECPS